MFIFISTISSMITALKFNYQPPKRSVVINLKVMGYLITLTTCMNFFENLHKSLSHICKNKIWTKYFQIYKPINLMEDFLGIPCYFRYDETLYLLLIYFLLRIWHLKKKAIHNNQLYEKQPSRNLTAQS